MRSIYDNVLAVISLLAQSLSGSSPVNGASVDTKGYNTAMLRARAEAPSGTPTTAQVTFALQESSDNSTWSAANDNTGNPIQGVATVTSGAAEATLRVEGLGLNRKRYLRAVATPAFTGGSSPATVAFAEILLGRGFNKPSNTAVSNT